MKTVNLVITWNSHTTLEVPDDWEVPATWLGFTDDQMEQIDEDAYRETIPMDWEQV